MWVMGAIASLVWAVDYPAHEISVYYSEHENEPVTRASA